MRTVLVFPPQVSPTYVPLGIATLAAAVRGREPACRLRAVDANLRLWQHQARQSAEGRQWEGFLRGVDGDFFDVSAYGVHRATWRRVEGQLEDLAARLRRHLAHGEADEQVVRLLDQLCEEILADDPELVGFSLFGLAQLPWALALARHIRNRQESRSPRRIVFGGAACAALRIEDLLAACPAVDGVVEGEGEAALLSLCRGEPLARVPGLRWREGDALRRNARQRVESLDELPPPDFTSLPVAEYFNPAPVLPVLYCRGCKWRRCRFCAHTASFGRYRHKRVQQLADELLQLGRLHGAQHFYFADLYVDAPDLESLADELLAREQRVWFHALGRPVRGYTAPRLAKLAAAGCRWISWGVESGSQRLLDVAGKGTRPATVQRVLRDAHAAGISNLMMMIFGLPTATDLDLEDTFAFIEEVYPYVDAMTASAFVLFEGTPFARRADHFGLVVTGPETELTVAGNPIRSRRLRFKERSAEGAVRPPRGRIEADAWHARRRWLGDVPFLEQVACEHYLLHVAARSRDRMVPPSVPPRRVA